MEYFIEKILFPLFSTFIGAFLAFRYQYLIEKRKDKRLVVQTLMIYRNVAADELDWIKAMNAIDLVFHDNERVRQLFDKYIECVNDDAKFLAADHVKVYYQMVYLMAQDCGYTQIMEADVKKNVYSPRALNIHYPNRYPDFHFDNTPKTAEQADLFEAICQIGLA